LITQGSGLHGSSRLYNHRAQGCEGELGVAAVSCGEQLVSQSSSCGEQLVTQSSSCGEQLISQSSSCGEQLISQSSSCGEQLVSQSSSCGEQLVSQSSSCGEQLVSQSLSCKKRDSYLTALITAKAKISKPRSAGRQQDHAVSEDEDPSPDFPDRSCSLLLCLFVSG
jgi:hypothetical protein